MLKEAKYFCPKCGKQDIVITTDNGAIMLSEDFSPPHFVNYKDHHWRCSSCDYKAKGENFFIAERTLTNIEEARELIINFCSWEYDCDRDNAIQKDATLISLAYTTIGDDKQIEFQTFVDLCEYKVLYYLDNKLIKTESYNNLKDMNEQFLKFLDFNELVSPQMLYDENRKEDKI